jgi:hypothetical protein
MADLRSTPDAHGRREGASSLRQQLKRETADLHRRLETDLGLLESDLALDRCRQVLEFFLGFYAPIEAGWPWLRPRRDSRTGFSRDLPSGRDTRRDRCARKADPWRRLVRRDTGPYSEVTVPETRRTAMVVIE